MRMESKQSKTLMLNSISPLVAAGHAPAVDKFYSEVTIWHVATSKTYLLS
jgi:hypothetical protein